MYKKIFKEINFFLTYFSTYEKLKYLSKIPLNIFKHILYISFTIVPRRKDIWVFGSWGGKRFGDNSKYMFLYTSNNHKEIKSIWLSKDKEIVKNLREHNYSAHYMYGLKGIYYNLRAKYIFSDSHFDSVNFWCCGGAKKVQLWHGIMLKNIGGNDTHLPWKKPLGKLVYRYFNPWLVIKEDFVLCTSNYFIDKVVKEFGVQKDKIIVTGYPRNDTIFNRIKGENLIDTVTYEKTNKIKNDSSTKIIFYMPTFRDNEFFSKESTNFDKIIKFEELNKYLLKINGYFVIKPHPLIKLNLKDYDRIISLPSSFDVYPFLSIVDILVTDYSSIYFDFLLTNKPIIFFPYDFDKYIKESRGLSLDYDKFAPGPKAFTFDDLLNWIDYFVMGNDEFIDKRKKILNLSFDHLDGKSSERIYTYISNLS